MTVKLREKSLSAGRISFYLDIYHNRKRYYEFLNIYASRKKPTEEDREKKRLAGEIRARREHELIVEDNGLIDKRKKMADFVGFFEGYIGSKARNGQRTATLSQLRAFVGNKSLPISRLNTEWMTDFQQFLLTRVSSNTVLTYLKNVNGALNELVRKQVISRNPWHDVPRHDRLRRKDEKRTAWTLDQLQLLANTPCNIKPQFKEAYFFACFTGLRWSDVNGLTWANIIRKRMDDVEQWFIHFEQQKTESVEYFPLSDQAIDILKRRETNREGESQYIFPLVKETNPKYYRVHSKVNYALKKWAKTAGLDHTKMRFHTGRHTYATNLLEVTNGDLYTVSKLLGHKSIRTTQIYAQVRDKMKVAAVKSLPKLNLGMV
jgi:integrase